MIRWYSRAASRNSVWRTSSAAWSRATSAVSLGSGPSDARTRSRSKEGSVTIGDCTGCASRGPCLDRPGRAGRLGRRCADGSPNSGRRARSPRSSRPRTCSTTRAGGSTSPRPTRPRSSSSATSGAPSSAIAGAWSRAGRTTRGSPRARSTPAPRPSPRRRYSATRSVAGAASCRSTASTNGCATGSARQPMRIHDPEERPLALAGLWTGRQDPGERRCGIGRSRS